MSQDKSIVVIGCSASGGTAAQFARKTDRKAQITVFEKGKYPQYSKCGLPYAVSGIIPDLNDLIEFSREWFKKAGIDLILNAIVEKIDVDKQVVIAKRDNSVIKKSYDSLIISTGANPFIPPIDNISENNNLVDGVFSIRTIEDVKNISYKLKKDKNAIIVGAGLIGLEMADNLIKKGLKVKIIEAVSQILYNTLDEDMAKLLYSDFSDKVDVILNHIVTRIESKNGKINQVFFKDKESGEEKKIQTDILIIATGCKPDVSLAKNAGCEIGKNGGIKVNEKCETNIKNIYAVGDCTEYFDFITKKTLTIGLGSIGVRQGIAAGTNAAGGAYQLPNGVLQTRTSEIFNMEIAAVGPTINNFDEPDIVSARFNGFSLPKYFPGGKPITIKVAANKKTGKIVSAQAIGANAAQRTNTFATAILGEMTIENFRKLETAYAPPIAPTLDVVTLVCDIISKKINRK